MGAGAPRKRLGHRPPRSRSLTRYVPVRCRGLRDLASGAIGQVSVWSAASFLCVPAFRHNPQAPLLLVLCRVRRLRHCFGIVLDALFQWHISPAFSSTAPIYTGRLLCPTSGPGLPDADWCWRSDAVPVLGLQVLIGASEGCNYPSQTALIARWIPANERARAWALYY